MKRKFLLYTLVLLLLCVIDISAHGQCSICTKTAQQLGERPAKGLNGGILYLAFFPLAIVAFIGIRWWRNNREA